LIYYRCYIEDYEAATRDLSLVEDGVYGRLLRHYFADEKPLPLNSDRLARICRAITLDERTAIDVVLARFFEKAADGWHNKRADHEIAVSRTARDNGSKGGRPTEQETGSITGSKTGSKTEQQTGMGGGLGQPFSLPTSQPTNPSTLQPSNLPTNPLPRASRRGGPKAGVEVVTAETWTAYSEAYLHRYGTSPIRDAQTNAQLCKLVKRLGADEAPSVAAFYVTHNRGVYVANRHPTNLLVRDVEGLRTDWATGRKGTDTEARQADRTQATGNAFAPLIAEAERTR